MISLTWCFEAVRLKYLCIFVSMKKKMWCAFFALIPLLAASQSDCPIPSGFCGVGTTWDDQSQSCLVAVPSDSNFDGCVQLTDLLDLLSVYGLTCSTEASWQCGDPLEFSEYSYGTVEIGEQCWFAENIRTVTYSNGDAIPSTLTDSQWNNANYGATTIYGEDPGCNNFSPDIVSCDPIASLAQYGRLYNWHAVNDPRAICPSGWHVPSDSEWSSLVSEWGGTSVSGDPLKSTYGWDYPGNGTNFSGFTGMPGGKREDNSGYYSLAGQRGSWWTSTTYANLARYRELRFNSGGVGSFYGSREIGYSVRCILD
jgi:uncharacterized protein (TIGR02145 family)